MRGMRRITGLLTTVLAVAVQSAYAFSLAAADLESLTAARESIQTEDLRNHATVLASDTFEGREAGERGGRAAGAYLAEALRGLGVAPAGPDGSYYQAFGSGYRNVLARLPGSDPQLKQEYVLVTAHYDHVGYGTRRNSLGPIGYIHNGADDNASGTSGLLELIEAISLLSPSPKRSLLFAFWDAEEKGLLGSEHWIEHPTVPLREVRLVINLDMIGRLRNQTVEVAGVGTAAGMRRLLSEGNRSSGLRLEFRRGVERTSDHYPFYTHKIPALLVHTGKHPDYHRPSDDVDKLNVLGIRRVVRLLFRVVYAASERPELPSFLKASLVEDRWEAQISEPASPRPPARLGVSWDADLHERGIVQLTGVRRGSPAEKAGFQVGDRILRFAGFDIDQVADFRGVVAAARNPVTAVLRRNGVTEPVTVTVHLRGQPRPVGITWRTDDAEPRSVILTRVLAGSPAENAGLKSGDRIYAVDGETFSSSAAFRNLIGRDPGTMNVLVERHGRIRNVHVELLTPPADQPDAPASTQAPRSAIRGQTAVPTLDPAADL